MSEACFCGVRTSPRAHQAPDSPTLTLPSFFKEGGCCLGAQSSSSSPDAKTDADHYSCKRHAKKAKRIMIVVVAVQVCWNQRVPAGH